MWILKIGVVFSILSIVIGAFGAHALENIISDKIEVFKTAVQYQIFHVEHMFQHLLCKIYYFY